jgi:hypothetical protein
MPGITEGFRLGSLELARKLRHQEVAALLSEQGASEDTRKTY